MPSELITISTFSAVPVSKVTAVASTVNVVRKSIPRSSAASGLVVVTVIA